MIAPDDPRHGSYAGAIQHWRAGERACDPCKAAARREDKKRELDRLAGRPPMVPLGEIAHALIAASPRRQMSAATGITSHALARYERLGPSLRVRRSTRDRILGFELQWTPVGIQRRLRALSVLGWSMKVVSDETGINIGSLCRLRRNPNLKFVRRQVADPILEFWRTHHMRVAPDSHSARETRTEALRRGWVSALAWDDIDNPTETPSDWQYRPADRADVLADLLDAGGHATDACRALSLSRDALQKWCSNHGLSHVYRALAAREAMAGNQYRDLDGRAAS